MPGEHNTPVGLEEIVNAQVTELTELERENAVLVAAVAAADNRETVVKEQFRILMISQRLLQECEKPASTEDGESHDASAASRTEAVALAVAIVEQVSTLSSLEEQVRCMHFKLNHTDDSTGELHGVHRLGLKEKEFLFELLAHHKHLHVQIGLLKETQLKLTRTAEDQEREYALALGALECEYAATQEAQQAQHAAQLEQFALESSAQHDTHCAQQEERTVQATAHRETLRIHAAAEYANQKENHDKNIVGLAAEYESIRQQHEARMTMSSVSYEDKKKKQAEKTKKAIAEHEACKLQQATELEGQKAAAQIEMEEMARARETQKIQTAAEHTTHIELYETRLREAAAMHAKFTTQATAESDAAKITSTQQHESLKKIHENEHAARLHTHLVEITDAIALTENHRQIHEEQMLQFEHEIAMAQKRLEKTQRLGEQQLCDAQGALQKHNTAASLEKAQFAAALDDLRVERDELLSVISVEAIRHTSLCETNAHTAAALSHAEDTAACMAADISKSTEALATVRLDIKNIGERKQFLVQHVDTLENVIETLSRKYAEFTRYKTHQHECGNECENANAYVLQMVMLVDSMLEQLNYKLDEKAKLMTSLLKSSDVATLA